MEWTFLDTWIVVTAALTSLACALLGNFLVLRRMSMMGDAISHAVLPGLATAFLLSGSRDSMAMFVGAAVVGILTALFTQWISHFGKVEESASMGVVFTGLFAVGLIMIVRAADAVDLDPGCVLYGAIEMVPLDTISFAGADIPRAALKAGAVLLINALFVIIFFKELKITSFDPALATTLGINARIMHYALMTLVAITTVAAFESVGSILVIAMLIVPAAAAHLLTDRLHTMIFASLIVALCCAVGGHLAALFVPGWWGFSDTSTAGGMAVVAGLLFFLVMLFAPRHGILSRHVHRILLALRIAEEDILGMLYRVQELESLDAPNREPVARLLQKRLESNVGLERLARWRLVSSGRMQRDAVSFQLTPAGREAGGNLIRSHRLWESYLYQQLQLPLDHLHPSSENLEHVTTPAMQSDLARRMDFPARDPHGHDIPAKKSE